MHATLVHRQFARQRTFHTTIKQRQTSVTKALQDQTKRMGIVLVPYRSAPSAAPTALQRDLKFSWKNNAEAKLGVKQALTFLKSKSHSPATPTSE